MDNQLEMLEERFMALAEAEVPEVFSRVLAEYLLFVEEVSPFNTIARGLTKSGAIASLYKELDGLREKYGDVPVGLLSYSFWDIQNIRPFVRGFHDRVVEGAKRMGLTIKQTIILYPKEAKICLSGEDALCYSIKGKAPQRFKIVEMLEKVQGGKSVSEILKLLHKDEKKKSNQDNIKNEIDKINKNFRDRIDVGEDLIVSVIARGKNIYSLNRNAFNFKIEK